MRICQRLSLGAMAIAILLVSGCDGGGAGGRDGAAGGSGKGGMDAAGVGGAGGTGGTGTTDAEAVDTRDAGTGDAEADDSRDGALDQPTTMPDAVSSDADGAGGAAGGDASGAAGGDASVPSTCVLTAGTGGTSGAGGTGGAPPPPCAGAAGDFDGDGIVDCAKLVTGSRADLQSVVFYKGLSSSAYSTTGVSTPDVVTSEQRIIQTYDLNHDGRMDIITGGLFVPDPPVSSVYLLRGEAGGTFSRASTRVAGANLYGTALPADYDGDGRSDLLLSSDNAVLPFSPHWIVLKSSADGTFGAAVSDPVAARAVIKPQFAGDVNMDGKVDLVTVVIVSPSQATYLAVSLNDGSGKFTTAAVPYTDGAGAVAVRDFDGDGKTDLSVGFAGVTVPFYGDGAGLFAPPPPANANTMCNVDSYRTAPRGDFDGDGVLDCAYLQGGQTPSTSQLVFRQGVVGGRYRVETVVTNGVPVGGSAGPYEVVDLNGDHRDDLLLQYEDQAAQRWVTVLVRGNADGTFGLPSNPPPAVSTSFMLHTGIGVVGDYNGDGRNDVLMAGVVKPAGSGPGPLCLASVAVIASSPDPSIVEGCSNTILASDAYVAAVADVNNDGKLDGVIVLYTSDGAPSPTFENRLAVALGDGTGKFTFAPSVGPSGIAGTEGFKSAVPVDCNGDGKLDLAVSPLDPGLNPKATAILYGDGKGGFAR